MVKVGFVGWRGMVGSVLMERMRAEGDFAGFGATFFSTSQTGQPGPAVGLPVVPLVDAFDLDALGAQDVVVTCQGSDHTNAVYEKLRVRGWAGYWIDAASALRMQGDAIIVLDPVNRRVIDAGLAATGREEVAVEGTRCGLKKGMVGMPLDQQVHLHAARGGILQQFPEAAAGQEIAHRMAAHGLESGRVEVDDQQPLVVGAALGEYPAVGPEDHRDAGELQTGAVVADRVAGHDKHGVVEGARRQVAHPRAAFLVGGAARRGVRHEDDVGSVERHAGGELGEMRIIAQLDAEAHARGIEDGDRVAGREHLGLRGRDVQFAVDAEKPLGRCDQMAGAAAAIGGALDEPR